MSNIGFKVTIEFECLDMIDKDTFKKEFNSNPLEAYKYISDDFNDDVLNFCEYRKGNILKVEVLEQNK